MGFIPEIARDASRIDTRILPPIDLDTGMVHLAVMSAAERHGELIADLDAETAGLREAKMVGIAGLPSADQARLLGDKSQVGFIAQAPQLRNGEQAFVDGTRTVDVSLRRSKITV